MDDILYQILKIIWSILSKKHETLTDNSAREIYINKVESRITFKSKTGYYLELLMPETTKLLKKYWK